MFLCFCYTCVIYFQYLLKLYLNISIVYLKSIEILLTQADQCERMLVLLPHAMWMTTRMMVFLPHAMWMTTHAALVGLAKPRRKPLVLVPHVALVVLVMPRWKPLVLVPQMPTIMHILIIWSNLAPSKSASNLAEISRV